METKSNEVTDNRKISRFALGLLALHMLSNQESDEEKLVAHYVSGILDGLALSVSIELGLVHPKRPKSGELVARSSRDVVNHLHRLENHLHDARDDAHDLLHWYAELSDPLKTLVDSLGDSEAATRLRNLKG